MPLLASVVSLLGVCGRVFGQFAGGGGVGVGGDWQLFLAAYSDQLERGRQWRHDERLFKHALVVGVHVDVRVVVVVVRRGEREVGGARCLLSHSIAHLND